MPIRSIVLELNDRDPDGGIVRDAVSHCLVECRYDRNQCQRMSLAVCAMLQTVRLTRLALCPQRAPDASSSEYTIPLLFLAPDTSNPRPQWGIGYPRIR